MEERLQKVLAAAGVASRRESEKIITAGRVKVNNKIITEMGYKVKPNDAISVDNIRVRAQKKVYYLFYKPRGIVTTMKDPQGRTTISDLIEDLKERVFPVGRLDYNTEGLLLLTNDGTLAQKLMHPSHEITKSYQATVPGIVPEEKLDLLRVGVKLEDGVTRPALVNLVGYDHEKNLSTFNISIHEGKNRQIRRMCDFIGYPVRKLTRYKMANLSINGLKKGEIRPLYDEELAALLKAAK
jgi:23S rRNA pseudouridine2605 synthase